MDKLTLQRREREIVMELNKYKKEMMFADPVSGITPTGKRTSQLRSKIYVLEKDLQDVRFKLGSLRK